MALWKAPQGTVGKKRLPVSPFFYAGFDLKRTESLCTEDSGG